MSTRKTLVNKQAKAYHLHQHLLLQFIWSELILASEHIYAALSIVEELEKSSKKSNRKALLDKLNHHITTLFGSAHDYMRLFAWGDDGILAKLKNYGTLFSQNSEVVGKEQFAIAREANKAWLLAVEALDEWHNSCSCESLLDSLLKIKHCISKLKDSLAATALQFRKDENVLFFILRHQDVLDSLHKRGFTKKLLNKMYPKGIGEIERLLIKQYTNRGFHQLLPFIRTKIEQLQDL